MLPAPLITDSIYIYIYIYIYIFAVVAVVKFDPCIYIYRCASEVPVMACYREHY